MDPRLGNLPGKPDTADSVTQRLREPRRSAFTATIDWKLSRRERDLRGRNRRAGVFDFGIRFAWKNLFGRRWITVVVLVRSLAVAVAVAVRFAGLGRFNGAKLQERVEGTGELTVEGGFVAEEEVEDAGVVGQVLEDRGGAVGGFSGRGLVVHFEIQGGLLDIERAEIAPAGDGHGVDQGCLGGGAGLEFGGEAGVELLEAIFGLAFEDDEFGEEAVADAVLRRDGFAFGRDRTVRFGAVGASGIEFALRAHTTAR